MVDLCGKGHMPMIPICGAVTTSNGNTVYVCDNLEFPFDVIPRRVFAFAQSAFGADKELTITISDGTNTETITSDSNVDVAETKEGSAKLSANTDISIGLALESGGTDAVTNVVVFFQPCSHFYDES